MSFVADFETTTDINDCRVWAYAVEEIGNPNNFCYGNNIDDFLEICKQSKNDYFYFHNLAFDGIFIMIRLFQLGFTHVIDRKELDTKTFTTLISDKGQFYSMQICFEKRPSRKIQCTLYDSLKVLPFSVEKIAKDFNLPISKLEIDYKEYREVGHKLTPLEVDYIRNDVSIVARALDVLFSQGLDKMTTGANALSEYKRMITTKKFEKWFPIPEYDYDVRQSYKGGFTYLMPKYKDVDILDGIVLDVNSLYPSVMRYKPLPYGEGVYFNGKYEEDKIYSLYVQFITCQFELKEGYIPTIQLKNNLAFVPTEYLESSGDEEITMCLTSVDLELFLEHYEVYNIIYHSGWKFKTTTGLFNEYIDYWTEQKINAKHDGNGAMYTIAKLMLNSLYGKFALNPKVRSKIPYYDSGLIRYYLGEEETRNPIYIPVGTFITAWARYTTITSAQKVYNRFVYADTDSLHLIGTEIPKELEIDDYELGKWKHESTFHRARFLRQKSYIEDLNPPETWNTPEYNSDLFKVTCAGLPDGGKEHVTWENFHVGAVYGGKLQKKNVVGGIILKDIDFSIKK